MGAVGAAQVQRGGALGGVVGHLLSVLPPGHVPVKPPLEFPLAAPVPAVGCEL